MPRLSLVTSRPSSPHRNDGFELALIQDVAAGDRKALSTLYRDYHRRLDRFLARMTRRADVIEEVINDTFWVVWQKAGDFRGESRVSTWIVGIAYRCALKSLRQHGANPVEDDDSAGSGPLQSDPGPARELRDWISKGMSRLNVEQRLTLELAYGEGHSLQEIATIMDCEVTTVKARMFHARVKLRNVLPILAGHAGQVAKSTEEPDGNE